MIKTNQYTHKNNTVVYFYDIWLVSSVISRISSDTNIFKDLFKDTFPSVKTEFYSVLILLFRRVLQEEGWRHLEAKSGMTADSSSHQTSGDQQGGRTCGAENINI